VRREALAMTAALWALYRRDLTLGWRVGGGAAVGVLFFLVVVTIVPLGVGPDLKLLSRIGPGILWIGALLADTARPRAAVPGRPRRRLARPAPDRRGNAAGHSSCSPSAAGALDGERAAARRGGAAARRYSSTSRRRRSAPTTLTLAAGTPALTFIGAIGRGAAGGAAARRPSGVDPRLPLAIPGADLRRQRGLRRRQDPAPFLPPFLILCALTLFFAVIGPSPRRRRSGRGRAERGELTGAIAADQLPGASRGT
jgi:heme exporter protein B